MPSLQRLIGRTAWLRTDVLAELLAEADCQAPLETGGVLLGYWSADSSEPVITHAIGPGPCAEHDYQRFLPDHEFHLKEIARLYAQSGRSLSYLGDWHSHPAGCGALSRKDRMTLRQIASETDARASRPMMLILANGSPWEPVVWTGELRQSFLIFQRCIIRQWSMKLFDALHGQRS